MKKILITGGTGNLGKVIVDLLGKTGSGVFVLTSQDGLQDSQNIRFIKGDLTDKDSLVDLKNQFDIIIHCASNALNSEAIDINGSRNLLDTVIYGKPEHFIYISIAGVDKSSFKYYQNKNRVENFIKESGIPYTIIRATQFHDLVLQRIIKPIAGVNGKKLLIPQNLRFQSIDKKDVAQKVYEVTGQNPENEIICIGGPEILSLEKMIDIYLTLLNRDEITESIPPYNELQKIFTTGINLCPENKYGTITWSDYLKSVLTIDNKQ